MDIHRRQVPKSEVMTLSKGDDGCCVDVVVSTSEEELWLDTSLCSKDR